MPFGLLLFDNSRTQPLAAKIAAAATRYEFRFGERPNTAFVNPADVDASWNEPHAIDGIAIKTAQTILPSCVWIGVAGS